MKICAIICEYNPFHNGHKYLISEAKRLSGCDGVLCLMSGSFTQRGDIAVTDKFTRAVHAVKGGADCVLQLPVSFSVAPAEIFALGAIKILSSIPDICCLTFGCENADKELLLKNAEILFKEDEEYKALLKKYSDSGESYAKSCQSALSGCGGDGTLLGSPNNILALEYIKALLKYCSGIDILPVKRQGSAYSESKIKNDYSSARAIRENIGSRKIKKNVPDYVYKDIKSGNNFKEIEKTYGDFLHFALIKNTADNIKRTFGCTEGLENKLKNEASKCKSADEIIAAATNKRYTSARIKRILCANLLELYHDDSKAFLDAELYLKPLAVKIEKADEILSALSRSPYPVVIRKNDTRALSEQALKCLGKDDFADETRAIICGEQIYNYTLKTV
ncbi:MAG: nucleotidyltransferase family protein [Clostridia bacterium]|nr:nucleotidyltransferase family protein [Clostridia bacterium]